MKQEQAIEILKVLRKATKDLPEPMSVIIAREYHKDPFLLLINCLLSLRAKDLKTLPVSRKLFSLAKTPRDFVEMSLTTLEKLIYSIGFYKQKARMIRSVSEEIIERFNGKVPKNRKDLLSIKGVGPKTASLVLSMAYDIPAICVDVHVHRLANLLGLVQTKIPLETEVALEQLLPRQYWVETNHLFVKLGQNIPTIVHRLPKEIQRTLKPIIPHAFKI